MIDWSYWLPQVMNGQHELSLLCRKLILGLRRDIFDRLPFEADDSFLEPTYFAAFAGSNPAPELGSLAVGYFCDGHEPFEFAVRANSDGVVVLPNIGSFRCEEKELELVVESENGLRHVFRRGARWDDDFGLVPNVTISDGEFLLYDNVHYLFNGLIRFRDGGPGIISKNEVVGTEFAQKLNRSLELLSSNFPDYFDALRGVTRGFLLFREPGINSFASDSAPGIAFLSVPGHVSVPYFLDDIAHQCGHLVFSSIFFDRESLFDTDPDKPIGVYTRTPGDKRSVYVVFHAVFTEYLIARCLLSCGSDMDSEEEAEVEGRLAFIMRKYEADLDSLSKAQGRIKGEGVQMYADLEAGFNELYSQSEHAIAGADLSGQPYSFDFEKYKKANDLSA